MQYQIIQAKITKIMADGKEERAQMPRHLFS